MKIQRSNNWSSLVPMKQADTAGGNFKEIMESNLKNDRVDNENLDTSDALEVHTTLKTEHFADIKRVVIPVNMRQSTIDSIKELVRDALHISHEQILQEIESVCEDETGEGIDMEQLNELLDLSLIIKEK